MTSLLLPEVDWAKLPLRAAFDTSVLVYALGGVDANVRSLAAVAVFQAMVAQRRDIVIPAPAYAELLRDASAPSLTAPASVEVVPFDEDAAHRLQKDFPPTAWKGVAKEAGLSRMVAKVDAMIIACALRHRCDVLVTLDGTRSNSQAALAMLVNLRVETPEAFLTPPPAQLPLLAAATTP